MSLSLLSCVVIQAQVYSSTSLLLAGIISFLHSFSTFLLLMPKGEYLRPVVGGAWESFSCIFTNLSLMKHHEKKSTSVIHTARLVGNLANDTLYSCSNQSASLPPLDQGDVVCLPFTPTRSGKRKGRGGEEKGKRGRGREAEGNAF